MKRILFVLTLSLWGLAINAQTGGTGTSVDPYWGDITTSTVWSVGTYPGNTVYIGTASNPDLRVVSNGILTIDPGITVIFKELTSDLIITGTGRLSTGASGSAVTFTKDASKSYWGHISFQSMDVSAGSSTINNCIIQYGDVRSNSGAAKYGGGIYADFSNLIIKNSVIQHNKAEWGGGIFINEDENPGIENCYLYDNFSKEAGGGIYLWNRASSVVKNCVFQANHCDGTTFAFYTGGGLGSQSSGNVKVLNCTFINNTSSRTTGQSVMLYNSTSNSLINCLIWGNTDNHLYLSGTNSIQYTAVQGSAPTGTGNFVLSATNGDATGPNFTDPASSDWTIKFISPCRDAGTTPSPAVPNDYLGNSRIGTYDIGAYEVQYSRWAGTTSDAWSSATNWVAGVDPASGTGDVIVPTGLSTYPINSLNPDFTIGSGKQMIIEQGARVTLGNLTNNGIIKLNHNSSGFASLIINSYTRGSGATEEIQLYLAGGGSELLEDYKWHYISSPVSSLSTTVFTGVTLDLAQFVESRPSGSLLEGWVAYDGYVYSTGVSNGPTFSTLTTGKGYNFWDNANNTFTFGGILNTSDVTMPLGYSAPIQSMRGFNLLGNPFSSGLNWNDIINNVYFTYPANTSKGVYFTRNNIQCTYINGVGTPADVDGIIPPMQGFFTKTYATGNGITLPAAARTNTNIHARYKSGTIIPLVRLELRKDSFSADETVVRFDAEAKSELDYDFDAEKMFLSSSKTQIYSVTGGTKFAINGQPFPTSVLEIPVVVNITKDTIHTISATQLQGLDGYGVFLRDYTTGFNADLKTTPVVTFSAIPGTITNRFVLSFTTTAIKNPENLSDKLFNIYPANGLINIQTLNGSWDGKSGSVRLMDLTGKTVSDVRNVEFNSNSLLQIPAPTKGGIYFVEIYSGSMRYVAKVVMR